MSSPVSSLSDETSFYTAAGSNSNVSTTASSPPHAQPCTYRDVRQLPRDLKQHGHIFLEEQLYSCAINLFNSVLASGISRQSPNNKPVPIPPSSHLAFLNTLTVHPLYTTRADKSDHIEVASQALDYLRNLLVVVGPLHADFKTAFQFHERSHYVRRTGYNTGNTSDASDGEYNHDDDHLSGKLANQSSLWNRGQDFSSVVGWAMNCSALYPRRWRYWYAWLDFMLELLEVDWTERERIDTEAHEANGKVGQVSTTSRQDSMIVMYINQQNVRKGSFKTIIKALLANGTKTSITAFPEVFEKEPRGRQKQSKKRKRETLDLEKNQFGDYFDDEAISSGASEPPTPQKSQHQKKAPPFGLSHPGIAESIIMRLRLFKLLSLVTYTVGKPGELNELYDDFSSSLKLLPIPLFSLFVSQRPNPLVSESHVTITKELFHLLLPSSYKAPRKVDPDAEAHGALTQVMLEECYAIHPANTVDIEDNAKLSIVVENAIQYLWLSDAMQWSEDLEAAVEKGVQAREAKVKKKRTGRAKATDPSDAYALGVLSNSAERIRVLLGALKATTETES